MGFIYYSADRKLITNKNSGINIRYIYNKEKEAIGISNPYENVEWYDGILGLYGNDGLREYDIYLYKPDSTYHFLIRAKQPYFDEVFEDFFQIGSDCCEWSKNIIIGVRKDQIGEVTIV